MLYIWDIYKAEGRILKCGSNLLPTSMEKSWSWNVLTMTSSLPRR